MKSVHNCQSKKKEAPLTVASVSGKREDKKGNKDRGDKKDAKGKQYAKTKEQNAAEKAARLAKREAKAAAAKTDAAAKPKDPLKTAEATIKVAAELGITKGTLTLDGKQVQFQISGISTDPEDTQEDSKPAAKGTTEEFAQSSATSASAQFGCAGRKCNQTEKTCFT